MSSFVEDLGVRRFLSSFNGLEVNATFDIGCDDDELVNMPTLCTKEIKGGGGGMFILFARVAVCDNR